jgi:hypothetical protein
VVAEAVDAARSAGLHYVTDRSLGIRRMRCGHGFRYVTAEGRTLRDRDELARIRALAVPPAWTDVWISASPRGHIQAFGRDARRRKQYRHPRWREVRDRPNLASSWSSGRRYRGSAGASIRHAQDRASARESSLHRGAPARDDHGPHRQSRRRARQPVLRPHHASRPPRQDQRAHAALPLHGEERQGPRSQVTDRRVAGGPARTSRATTFSILDEEGRRRTSTPAT